MSYRLLADAVVLLHLFFILYAVFGGVLVLRFKRTIWLHLPAVIWAGAVEFAGWLCPLTRLENHFRIRAGLAGYSGGFIEHTFIPIIYPDALTRTHQVLLGAAVIAVNAIVYAAVVMRARHAGRG